MNAAAVVKSIEAAKDHAGANFIWAPLDTITAVDDATVEMKLKYAAPMDLIAGSLYGAWIVSPAALDAVAADPKYFETGPVDGGTGPYTIESYTPGSEVLLKAYDGYWGGWSDVKHYDKVLASIIPESVDQQLALDGGTVDMAINVPVTSLADYAKNPDYTFKPEPALFNYVGLFNTAKAPLDDPKVRQALSYAIPYGDIIQVATQGYGTQAHGPVPAGVFPYDGTVPQYSYDLDKAKQLLKDAGHEGGGFSMEITYAAENPAETLFAPLIQDSFSKLGIDVTLTPMGFDQQWARAKGDPAGRQDMFLLYYWPTYSDAGSDNMYSLFHSSKEPSFNLSYWNDPTYDGLIDDAATKTGTDRAAAQKGYSEALNRLVDQAPGVFLYDTQDLVPVPNKIAGYKYNLNYPFARFFYPLHPAQ